MLELYAISSAARIALTVTGCALVAVQATHALYSVHARGIDEPIWGILAQWCLLPLYFLVALLPAAAQLCIEDGLIVISGYDAPRYLCGILAATACFGFGAMGRRMDLALNGLLAILSLPHFDSQGFFVPSLLALLSYGLFRAGACVMMRYLRRERELNYASIKEAIDRLPGGLMFYEQNGFIRLINRRMRALMAKIAGPSIHSGLAFWDALRAGSQADRPVIRQVDGRIWRFICRPIAMRRRVLHGLRAVDVTELWKRHRTLDQKRAEISLRNEALEMLIANMEKVRLAQEAGRAWRRVHDVIGLRVSLLQRALREDLRPDIDVLLPLMETILEEIREGGRQSSDIILSEVLNTFSAIGVQVHMEGVLPSDPDATYVFVTAIREGAVNAVRHARAKHVFIHLDAAEGFRTLRIENDGDAPERVIEGDGLTAVRENAESIGGQMRVCAQPRFALELFLPERSEA